MSSCMCHGKSVIQALLYFFVFCRLIAGGLMVFSAASSFFVWSRRWYRRFGRCWARKKNDCMLRCAILMQLDLEWKRSGKNRTAELIYPNRNGMVRYLAVSTRTLGPVHSGDGGAVTVFASSMSVWCDSECLLFRSLINTGSGLA